MQGFNDLAEQWYMPLFDESMNGNPYTKDDDDLLEDFDDEEADG